MAQTLGMAEHAVGCAQNEQTQTGVQLLALTRQHTPQQCWQLVCQELLLLGTRSTCRTQGSSIHHSQSQLGCHMD